MPKLITAKQLIEGNFRPTLDASEPTYNKWQIGRKVHKYMWLYPEHRWVYEGSAKVDSVDSKEKLVRFTNGQQANTFDGTLVVNSGKNTLPSVRYMLKKVAPRNRPF